MNIWQRIKAFALKLFHPSFAVDYILTTVVNPWLSSVNVAANLAKARTVYGYVKRALVAFQACCPAGWRTELDATIAAVDEAISVFDDNEVTFAEIERVVAATRKAIAAYMAD